MQHVTFHTCSLCEHSEEGIPERCPNYDPLDAGEYDSQGPTDVPSVEARSESNPDTQGGWHLTAFWYATLPTGMTVGPFKSKKACVKYTKSIPALRISRAWEVCTLEFYPSAAVKQWAESHGLGGGRLAPAASSP